MCFTRVRIDNDELLMTLFTKCMHILLAFRDDFDSRILINKTRLVLSQIHYVII